MTATALFSDLRWTAEQVLIPQLNRIYKLLQLRTVINVPDIREVDEDTKSYSILYDHTGEVLCNVLVPKNDVTSFREFQTAIIRSRIPLR